MDTQTVKSSRNRLLADTVMNGLRSRNMSGYYTESKEEALAAALRLIPEGSRVAMGGCMSAYEIGLVDALKNGSYHFIDYEDDRDPRETELQAYDADVYLSSANAMTEGGILVNIDGNSNRVSALAYGPKKVIVICSLNKVCPDLDLALKRARNTAAPLNAVRYGGIRTVPCQKTGTCADCLIPDTLCCQFLVTRYSRHAGRIHVILVGEALGF
ncbi:MAG: lactate utilization protein [Lachnospiraceae bacterium]|nr:lactate utilization protein [Lachnospiraceae bacterium]